MSGTDFREEVYNMKASLSKLIGVLVLVTAACSYGDALSYTCYPNATVIIDNPGPGTYISALAEDADETCTATWLTDITKAKLELTDCEIDGSIVVSFSDRVEDADEIYGGATVATYTIKCAQIDATGVTRTVTQGLSPSLSTASEASVSPIIIVVSALRSASQTSPPVTTATVGEHLYWTIDVPEEYTARATCTVYAGTEITLGSSYKQIVDEGCSQDKDLVLNFDAAGKTLTTLPSVTRYWTSFWAFKFYNNDHIFIHCNVKFCPTTSNFCDISCAGRKRRAIAQQDEPGVKHGVTSRVLKVVEMKPDFLTGGAPRTVASVWTYGLVAVATVVLMR